MLEQEFNWFLSNQKELFKIYPNKFIVIVGSEVVGKYDSEAEAYAESIKTRKLGSFLIQFCAENQSDIIQTFYTHRVAF